ncbi:MAG TPA: hypothetical protein ENH32_07720 [Proteobacteria bacterium]|nr:hypothetical protein BMS3Abin14_00608 [bacterium BMS3Abin14]HDL53140.1 hypothetical protein [Pseudomonadota bacterium]HDL53846.1 hypothetical protein [Pseudomonadota bacterium]
MGKVAKLDVTAAIRMARAKAAVQNNTDGSIVSSFLKKAMGIYGDLSAVVNEAMNNAADAELKTSYRRNHTTHRAG